MKSPAESLAELYAADLREHPAVPAPGTVEYAALRERDRERRDLAFSMLAELRKAGSLGVDDLFHAAWLFNHGDSPDDAKFAHELASVASRRGHAKARWLAAAAYDRWCMYDGRPQKYGTQFVPDGERFRLWDVEPTTTDAERAEWDVPSLAVQLARADEMTRTEPQPSMDRAPEWLRGAIERWRAADSTP